MVEGGREEGKKARVQKLQVNLELAVLEIIF